MNHPFGKVIYCPQCWRRFSVNEINRKNLPTVNCDGCERVLDEIVPDRPKPKSKPPEPPAVPSLF
jgi:hypothetical protein